MTIHDSAPDASSVRLETRNDIAVVTLERVKQRNALSIALCRSITATLGALEPGTRAVVLTSAGADFCVGADLVERHSLLDVGFDEARAASTALTSAVLDCPVPVIVAITGYTLGGGLELALCADLIVADQTAVLGLPETRVGIVPGGGGSQLLERRVGWGRAVDLLLTGRRVDADEAERIGLVDHLAPNGDALGVALEVAGEIAAGSPSSVRLARAAMRDGSGLPAAEALAIEDAAWRVAASSADYRASLEAFAAKRDRGVTS